MKSFKEKPKWLILDWVITVFILHLVNGIIVKWPQKASFCLCFTAMAVNASMLFVIQTDQMLWKWKKSQGEGRLLGEQVSPWAEGSWTSLWSPAKSKSGISIIQITYLLGIQYKLFLGLMKTDSKKTLDVQDVSSGQQSHASSHFLEGRKVLGFTKNSMTLRCTY